MSDDVEAFAVVPRERGELFDFLSSLENHWELADRWIEVVNLETPPGAGPDGAFDRGEVLIKGPLGLHRRARTQVLHAERPRRMEGSAEIVGGTRGRVSWTLEEHPDGTLVRLAASVVEARPIDRLLLALGGRAWLRRRFARVLDALRPAPPAAPVAAQQADHVR